MNTIRILITLGAAVIVTACGTSGQQPRVRFVGIDGRELQQIVPLGVAGPEAPSVTHGQVKAPERVFQQIQAAVPKDRSGEVLVTVSHGQETAQRVIAPGEREAAERLNAAVVAAMPAGWRHGVVAVMATGCAPVRGSAYAFYLYNADSDEQTAMVPGELEEAIWDYLSLPQVSERGLLNRATIEVRETEEREWRLTVTLKTFDLSSLSKP